MSLYRSAVWFAKGLREYTKSGYESAAKDFVPDDLEVQVPGRAFLVTGGNSGIGKATATEIAKRGGTVHLVCRDQERAEGAKAEIIRESGNQNIFLHIVDLSDPKKIWKFAEDFKQEHKLNVLITVSSGGMLVQKLNINDLQSERTAFDGTMVYAQNKRQQVVLTEHWARAHPTIHFSSMHPGWVDTPGVQRSMPGFYSRLKDRLRSAAQGADTVLWLALTPAATAQRSGCFFQDRKPVPTHLPLARTSSSLAEEEKLMEILEELAHRFK
ncbi:dehydrogenase/reductase SDR family member 12 isoform X3 [Erinaceus europaeus]|uniref:Dehydrogenase/reductase SDR family member 12 isoform X3 n=1 Tax=Erinaceus europaeus TaxID=9365 RepID=A0ABM3XPW7_ERIEU|nr:dehydrogenase/reductase SDR family member 12 isoform X3 [Erinaceus europaeus]